MDIQKTPYTLIVDFVNPTTGTGKFEMEKQIQHTALKASHYQVSTKVYVQSRVRNGSNFISGNTSAVLIVSNLQPYQEISRNKKNVLASMLHENSQFSLDNFGNNHDCGVFEKPQPILKLSLWDVVNQNYYTNDNVTRVYLEMKFSPMTPKEDKLGANNMNRFVGTSAYPSRAM